MYNDFGIVKGITMYQKTIKINCINNGDFVISQYFSIKLLTSLCRLE